MKKKPPYNQNAVIRGALRRAFARSPLVLEKLNESRREVPRFRKDGSRAKKDAVQRQCEVCLQWVGSTKIAIDHIDPVISVKGAKLLNDGSQDWNDFIDRLWCNKTGKANLQRVCDTCHQQKTNQERFERSLKVETNSLLDISNSRMKPEDAKKWLKKYTAKRLAKFPYPHDFVKLIGHMRRRYGMRV